MKSQLSLRDVFQAFDRDASGSISLAEFASLMRMLGEKRLNKKEVYYLMHCLDRKHDRRVDQTEFVEFWLIVHANWLQHLNRTIRDSPQGQQRLSEMIPKVRNALEATFGNDFQSVLESKQDFLSPSFANLMSAPSPTKRSRPNNINHTRHTSGGGNNMTAAKTERASETGGLDLERRARASVTAAMSRRNHLGTNVGDESVPRPLRSSDSAHAGVPVTRFSQIHMGSSGESETPTPRRRPHTAGSAKDGGAGGGGGESLQQQAGSTLNALLSRYLEPSPYGSTGETISKPRGTGLNAVRSQQHQEQQSRRW
jgi:hypothetical protein